jgi:hypothetical protein
MSFNGPRVLGDRVEIDLSAGGSCKPPASHGLIHDPTGRGWPKNSLLIGPFTKTGRMIEDPSDDLQEWFGSEYETKEGDIHFPPREGWTDKERTHAIWYTRSGGAPYGRQPFVHHIKKRSFPFFGKKIAVWVSSRGDWLRVDFPQGLKVSWRGIEEA